MPGLVDMLSPIITAARFFAIVTVWVVKLHPMKTKVWLKGATGWTKCWFSPKSVHIWGEKKDAGKRNTDGIRRCRKIFFCGIPSDWREFFFPQIPTTNGCLERRKNWRKKWKQFSMWTQWIELVVEVGRICTLRALGKDDDETLWLVTEIHIKSGRKKEKVTNTDDDRIEFRGTLISFYLSNIIRLSSCRPFHSTEDIGKIKFGVEQHGKRK